MIVDDAETRLAYSYAWWLTGDEGIARSAVLAAVARPEVPGADDDLRVEILLRRVRAASITAPTMCPASELALLHDGIGLPLDAAAGLAMIDSREARTELAHGRLEALGPGAEVEVVEPHRLGGLAVGNPADVAATRQNPKLAALRDRILEGRDELAGMAAVAAPEALLDQVRARVADERAAAPPDMDHLRTPAPALPPTDAAAQAAPVTDPDAVDPDVVDPDDEDADDEDADDQLVDLSPAAGVAGAGERNVQDAPAMRSTDVDLSSHVGEIRMPLGAPRPARTMVWVATGLAAVAAVTFLVMTRGDLAADDPATELDQPAMEVATTDGQTPVDASSATPATAPTPPATATAAASDTAVEPDPTSTDAADVGPVDPTSGTTSLELVLIRAGVAVGIGAEATDSPPTAGPFDPIAFAVTYTGAEAGDALLATWTVEGEDFDVERVDLLAGSDGEERTSRFTRQIPGDTGWPPGQHRLEFRSADEPADASPLGSVTFVVEAPDGA